MHCNCLYRVNCIHTECKKLACCRGHGRCTAHGRHLGNARNRIIISLVLAETLVASALPNADLEMTKVSSFLRTPRRPHHRYSHPYAVKLSLEGNAWPRSANFIDSESLALQPARTIQVCKNTSPNSYAYLTIGIFVEI